MVPGKPTHYRFDVGEVLCADDLYALVSKTLGIPCPWGPYSVVWGLEEWPVPFVITISGLDELRARRPLVANLFEIAMREATFLHAAEGCELHVV
jgi:hypothetical protein